MFEDSLMESTGQIRTRSTRYAIASFVAQAAILSAIILAPIIYPAALPHRALESVLVAPQPPAATPRVVRAQPVSIQRSTLLSLAETLHSPKRIDTHTVAGGNREAAWSPASNPFPGSGTGMPGRFSDLILGAPGRVVRQAAPKGPVRVSSGVAAGQLVHPIQAMYPAIARAAHIQGTVVLEAKISRAGTIEAVHVVSGPPMLRQAAIDAVEAARYRPFLLNGEPVEIESTINIVFSMNN